MEEDEDEEEGRRGLQPIPLPVGGVCGVRGLPIGGDERPGGAPIGLSNPPELHSTFPILCTALADGLVVGMRGRCDGAVSGWKLLGFSWCLGLSRGLAKELGLLLLLSLLCFALLELGSEEMEEEAGEDEEEDNWASSAANAAVAADINSSPESKSCGEVELSGAMESHSGAPESLPLSLPLCLDCETTSAVSFAAKL